MKQALWISEVSNSSSMTKMDLKSYAAVEEMAGAISLVQVSKYVMKCLACYRKF
jgi:hypothetical protein